MLFDKFKHAHNPNWGSGRLNPTYFNNHKTIYRGSWLIHCQSFLKELRILKVQFEFLFMVQFIYLTLNFKASSQHSDISLIIDSRSTCNLYKPSIKSKLLYLYISQQSRMESFVNYVTMILISQQIIKFLSPSFI